MRRFFAHSISVARSPAGRNLYGAGNLLAICRSISTFDGKMGPSRSGAKWRSWRSAAEWNVEARTPAAPSAARRERSSLAALSVNVTAMIAFAGNAPVATCCAMRRVIVVVFPDPAPARMHTGPRTVSAARRCSGFRPSRGSTEPPYPPLRRAPVTSMQRVFQNRFGADAVGLFDHRRDLRDRAERVGVLGQALEFRKTILEPLGVDRRPGGAHDLRV